MVPSPVRRAAAAPVAALAAALAGAVTGAVIAALLPLGAILRVVTVGRSRSVDRRITDALLGVERRRLGLLGGPQTPPAPGARTLTYLLGRALTGPPGGVVVATGLALGLGYAGWSTALLVTGAADRADAAVGIGVGLVVLLVTERVAAGLAVVDHWSVRCLLGRSGAPALRRRITELSRTRADVVEAVDDERRRIERDLHDGVQQHLVALGLVLGRARRAGDPVRTAMLLAQAHEDSVRALAELREVAWRIHPATLDTHGLAVALETVADRATLPVRLRVVDLGRLPRSAEAAAYFVVCEAVTNAVKHSRASRVAATVHRAGGMLTVRVEDDGVGGADPAGGGLSGLARRVAAVDGTLVVTSPSGGPTIVSAELPCG